VGVCFVKFYSDPIWAWRVAIPEQFDASCTSIVMIGAPRLINMSSLILGNGMDSSGPVSTLSNFVLSPGPVGDEMPGPG